MSLFDSPAKLSERLLATLQRLAKDKAELEPHIPLGPVYTFNDVGWKDFIAIEGLWIEQGKEPNARTPVHLARVESFKSAGLCVDHSRH